MKYIFSILLCIILQTGFSQIIKTVGISYTNGTPTYTPAKAGSSIALDTVTWRYYTWNGSTWLSDGFRVQAISGCSAPAYTPTKFQSYLVINACTAGQGGPELYFWTGSAWLQINEGATVSEPANQVVYGTGSGVDSDADLKYINDTLLLAQGRIKIKSTNEDAKIIIDNRKPFVYTSGTVSANDRIMTVFPPVDRNVATADTTPNFYMWNSYLKNQALQTGDNVFGMGFNFDILATQPVPNFPSIGLTMENWFEPNTTGGGLTEFITHWRQRSGGAIKRPVAWYGNNTTNTLSMLFETSVMSISNLTSGLEVYNNTGGTFIYKGSESTGADASPIFRLADQRNTLKYSDFRADTSTFAFAARKYLTFELFDASGWVTISNRLANTKLLFGTTATQVSGRPFFETVDDGTGFYKGGGTILLGGYSALGQRDLGGYGAVGSNYYLDASGGRRLSAADVANGIYFLNNSWVFWNAPAGAANSVYTPTTRATIGNNGYIAVGATSSPLYAVDGGYNTGAFRLPQGTTAQGNTEIAYGGKGLLRLNTTTGKVTVNRFVSGANEDILTRQDTIGATAGQVLTWSGSIWAPTTITVTSGTYTPTLTGVTNLTSSTAKNCQYSRNGNIVTVFGSLDATTTLAVSTEVGISLPIASALAAATDANGIANASSAIASNGYLEADATNDRAALKFIGLSIGGTGTIFFSFSYNVL